MTIEERFTTLQDIKAKLHELEWEEKETRQELLKQIIEEKKFEFVQLNIGRLRRRVQRR